MPIACPYCDHRLNLKSPKPGRFRPRCPKCVKPFVLVVPEGADEPCEVRAVVGDTIPTPVPTPAPAAVREPVAVGAAAESHLFGYAKTNPDLQKGRSDVAPAAAAPSAPRPVGAEPAPPRADIRGYRIERELGRGGMGAVFLARQLSLDRPVALKVMGKRWAHDPVFVARFTREAYAAAQLSHPNIVQIHDIGEVAGARFFSMEYVPGQSLADLVKNTGKLDPETAIGYVLQAARGLKHAHERGMIHRDVKPDNLLLDTQGLVKVADLGLVKTGTADRGPRIAEPEPKLDLAAVPPSALAVPNSALTGARIALGTPTYMSPEQCRDAAAVDHRADIYSLGCTLYVLVTGRPPFDGTTAVELMTKHAYEPLVPPEQIVSRLPREVSAVIQRMMAKSATDRFQNMGEVVRTLEAWLGVRQAGTFSPPEEQIDQLEGYAHQFNTAPKAVLRGRVLRSAVAAVGLAAVLVTFFGKLTWVSGLVGLVLQAGLAYFLLDGVARKGPLFTRVRRFVFGLGWGDWAVAVASLGLFVLLLWMLGVLGIWAGFGCLGIGLAFAVRYGLDRPAEEERRPTVEECEKLLRRLRMQGLDEVDVRQFVAKFAGRHWEEFFEVLFGYEAKLEARAVLQRGGAAGPREKHAAWREPLIALIERVEKTRKEARERKLLAAVEQARLLADGASAAEAERQARKAADAMVQGAERVRQAEAERVRAGQHTQAALVNVGQLAHAPEDSDFTFIRTPRQGPVAMFVGLFVGPHVRGALAVVLLAACGLWAHQNGLLPGAEVKEQATAAVEAQNLSGLQQTAALDADRPTNPLHLDGVAEPMTAWADSFNLGIAGILLLVSLFYRGNTMAVFVLLGAAVAVFGARCGIRTVDPFRDHQVALMLGSVLALVGFRASTR